MKKECVKRNLTGTISYISESMYDGGPLFARIEGNDGRRYTLPDFEYPRTVGLAKGMRVRFSLYRSGVYENAADIERIGGIR